MLGIWIIFGRCHAAYAETTPAQRLRISERLTLAWARMTEAGDGLQIDGQRLCVVVVIESNMNLVMSWLGGGQKTLTPSSWPYRCGDRNDRN